MVLEIKECLAARIKEALIEKAYVCAQPERATFGFHFAPDGEAIGSPIDNDAWRVVYLCVGSPPQGWI